jgi:SAM-dependent methyltransferase
MMPETHWESIYSKNAPSSLSWFQEHPDCSIRLIRNQAGSKSAGIIDAGGGASTLVDHLLLAGFSNLTVLDLSPAALDVSKARLGSAAHGIRWIAGNILSCELPEKAFEIWHDRAVFHFLATEAERTAYTERVLRSLKPGGFLILAAFAGDGPERCSGLPVVRYTPEALAEALGSRFELLCHEDDFHRTPSGMVQHFIFCTFKAGGATGSH